MDEDKIVAEDTYNDGYRATLRERERCIALMGQYLTGEIGTQWELRELLENGAQPTRRDAQEQRA